MGDERNALLREMWKEVRGCKCCYDRWVPTVSEAQIEGFKMGQIDLEKIGAASAKTREDLARVTETPKVSAPSGFRPR